MNQTIRLTRIHALNWYGYKDSISVEGICCLRCHWFGQVHSHGLDSVRACRRPTLVALQTIGYRRQLYQFRPVVRSKDIVLGDTKEEENGVTQYMRQSTITYVALEFSWPKGKRVETWGIRVEFVSAAEAHGKITPFFILFRLGRNDFSPSRNQRMSAFRWITRLQGARGKS